MGSLTPVPTSLSTSQIVVLPQEEPFIAPLLSVSKSTDWNFYGNVSTLITQLSEAATFMTNNTKDLNLTNTHKYVLAALTSFLKTAHTACETAKSSCWFTIRMTTPTTEFTIPRWHRDGNFFKLDFSTSPFNINTNATIQPRSKFATTLLGPQTLLLNIPHTDSMLAYLADHDSDFGRSWLNWREDTDHELRRKADEYFREKGVERVEARLGQIVRFAWGSGVAAVHSEPDMSSGDRIFVSVMFGAEEELWYMCGVRRVMFQQ